MSFEHASHESSSDFDPEVYGLLDHIDRSLAPPTNEVIEEVDAIFEDEADLDDLTLTPDARIAKLLLEREAQVTLDAVLEILSEILPEDKPTMHPIRPRLDSSIKPRAEDYLRAWNEERRKRLRKDDSSPEISDLDKPNESQ